MWCEEYSPETFFDQTAQTFRAALKGRRAAERYRIETALLSSWQTGRFVGLAFNGKLKPFAHYAAEMKPRSKHAGALHFFRSIKAKGAPVQIKRIVKGSANGSASR